MPSDYEMKRRDVPPYLTPGQAARVVGVRPETIRLWIHAGHLPAVRTPGGLYRIVREDLLLALRPARERGRQLCCVCDERTGGAGRSDGSLYADGGGGPFCLRCWELLHDDDGNVRDTPPAEPEPADREGGTWVRGFCYTQGVPTDDPSHHGRFGHKHSQLKDREGEDAKPAEPEPAREAVAEAERAFMEAARAYASARWLHRQLGPVPQEMELERKYRTLLAEEKAAEEGGSDE